MWIRIAMMFCVVSNGAFGQAAESIPLPSKSSIVGIQATPDGAVMLLGKTRMTRFVDNEFTPFELAQSVDDLALTPSGFGYALRNDTLGLVAGERPFDSFLKVPSEQMRIVPGDSGAVFLFGGSVSNGDSESYSIYELEGASELRRVTVLPEPIVDVEDDGEYLFIATRRVVFLLWQQQVEPYFASDQLHGIQDIDIGADGSLFIASDGGVLVLPAGSNSGRWLSNVASRHVLAMPGNVFAIDTSLSSLVQIQIPSELSR